MRHALLLLLFTSLVGCGEIELEGPQRESAVARCEAWEHFDAETGRCVQTPCRFDEDCQGRERCDRIDGICR